MDFATKTVEWRAALLPGAQQILDLIAGPRGLVFGIADRKTLFVFDPAKRAIVHRQEVATEFGPSATGQGPRVFAAAPDGTIYVLLRNGVARWNVTTVALEMAAKSSIPIDGGGAYRDGRIYFLHGSHLYSVRVKGSTP